jgi:hypothetical protein
MKTVILLVSLLLICGCGERVETLAQKKSRWRKEAQKGILQKCTNSVVGIRGIIRTDLQDSDDSLTKWSGSAVVEYVNRVGGVERTNLYFRFFTIDDTFTGRDVAVTSLTNE